MLKKIKKLAAVFALSTMLALPVLAGSTVSAQEGFDVGGSFCGGVEGTGPSASGDCGDADTNETGITSLVQRVVNWLSWFVGIVSVIMIVVGGFKYITSGGDSSKVTGAKNTIIYAIIGLVIVALAQFIVRFVVNQAGTLEG